MKYQDLKASWSNMHLEKEKIELRKVCTDKLDEFMQKTIK